METIEQTADKYVLELDTAQYTETTIKDAFLAGYNYGKKDIVLTDKKPEDITMTELGQIKRRVENDIANILFKFSEATKINDFDIDVTKYYCSGNIIPIAKIDVKIK